MENQLADIDKALCGIDYRQANMKASYVYIISNIGDASVPFNFDVHAMIFSDDALALEAALHRAFEDRKLNMVNQRREFFNVTLDEIKEADAEQYRVSLKIYDRCLWILLFCLAFPSPSLLSCGYETFC